MHRNRYNIQKDVGDLYGRSTALLLSSQLSYFKVFIVSHAKHSDT